MSLTFPLWNAIFEISLGYDKGFSRRKTYSCQCVMQYRFFSICCSNQDEITRSWWL